MTRLQMLWKWSGFQNLCDHRGRLVSLKPETGNTNDRQRILCEVADTSRVVRDSIS